MTINESIEQRKLRSAELGFVDGTRIEFFSVRTRGAQGARAVKWKVWRDGLWIATFWELNDAVEFALTGNDRCPRAWWRPVIRVPKDQTKRRTVGMSVAR